MVVKILLLAVLTSSMASDEELDIVTEAPSKYQTYKLS